MNNGLKIAILFFSPTGNCERIARKIADYFDNNADLTDITYRLKEKISLPAHDIVFLVFPVYSQLCAAPFKQFLKNVRLTGAAVPCVSYGGVSAGRALKQLSGTVQKTGAKILTGAEFASSHCYTETSGSDTFVKESADINLLCSEAVSRFNEKVCLTKIPVRHFNPLAFFMPKLRAQIGVRLKSLDKEVCDACKKCKSNCPFGAVNENLKTNGACQRCGACVKKCGNKKFLLRPVMRKYLEKQINHSGRGTWIL